jgi:hypothetical protein
MSYNRTKLLRKFPIWEAIEEGVLPETLPQYWNQDVGYVDNIQGEIVTLTNSLSYVKDQAIAIVQNYSSTATDIVTDLFDLIIGIVTTGPVGITDIVIPNSYASTDQSIVDAYTFLVDSQNTIANDTIAYINTSTSGFSYDEEKCARDVRYIIQSVAFDLLHSGNRQSIMSGVYYYGYDGTDFTPGRGATRYMYEFCGDIYIYIYIYIRVRKGICDHVKLFP